MVLSRPIRVLAATDCRGQYRREEEGPLADVYTPHHHMHPRLHVLRLPSDSSGHSDTMSNGCGGFIPTSGKDLEVSKVQACLRHCVWRLYGDMAHCQTCSLS